MNSDILIGINKLICEKNNCESVVINNEVLESAVGNTQWFQLNELKACALFRSIILNHPFRDGNKRTACLALISIKEPPTTQEELESITLDVAKGNLKEPQEICRLIYNL